jgi:hypothetical protein
MNAQYKPSEIIEQKIIEKHTGRKLKRKLKKLDKYGPMLDQVHKYHPGPGEFDAAMHDVKRYSGKAFRNKVGANLCRDLFVPSLGLSSIVGSTFSFRDACKKAEQRLYDVKGVMGNLRYVRNARKLYDSYMRS